MGHITPLISLYKELKLEYDIIYFGLENSMEEEVCKRENITFHKMKLLPFYRKNIFKNILTFFYIFMEKNRIKKMYKDDEIKACIVSGGFVSIPLVLAFRRKNNNIKILLEPNTTMGLANKLLSIYVDYICVQFSRIFTNKKCVVTGNPIDIVVSKFDHPFFYKNERLILFLGGSNGALEIVKLAYEFNKVYPDIKIFVITGKNYYETYKFNNNAAVYKKIDNISSIFNKFSLIVSRAGASTITEIITTLTPSILFPSNNVSGNHQYLNAKYLFDHRTVKMIEEINPIVVYDIFNDLVELSMLKKALAKLKIEGSTQNIIKLISKSKKTLS